MTPSEIRRLAVERLAVEVMGWTEKTEPPYERSYWFPKDGGPPVYHKGEWDPFSNLSDAFMVAEKIPGTFQLWRHDEGFGCRMGGLGCMAKDGHGKTPAEAISRAALAWLSAREG